MAGDQSVGKSQLLNRLMPEDLQNVVKLPVQDGTATRWITTLQFIRSDENIVEIKFLDQIPTHTKISSKEDLKKGGAQVTEAIQKEFQRICNLQSGKYGVATNFQFFTTAATITIKHSSIDNEYCLVDMPGLRSADHRNREIIEQKFKEELSRTDLLLACGIASSDPATWSLLHNVQDVPVDVDAVITKADQDLSPQLVDRTGRLLSSEFKGIQKVAVTCAEDSVEYEMSRFQKFEKQHKFPPGTILGTSELLAEIAAFYTSMVVEKYPEVQKLALQLMHHIRAVMAPLSQSVSSRSVSPQELIVTSYQHIISPVFLEQESKLILLKHEAVAEAQINPKKDWIRQFLNVNPTWITEVIKNNPRNVGRIRGTEGLYDYLAYAYDQIGGILVEHCGKMMDGLCDGMKAGCKHALRKNMGPDITPEYLKIYERYIDAIDGSFLIGPDMHNAAKELSTEVFSKRPSSGQAYLHNFFATGIREGMARELQKLVGWIENGLLDVSDTEIGLAKQNLTKLYDDLGDVATQSETVMEKNVENCVVWYWETSFSEQLVKQQIALLDKFEKKLVDAVKGVYGELSTLRTGELAEYGAPPVDPKLQDQLARLQAADRELSELLGSDPWEPRATRSLTGRLAPEQPVVRDTRPGMPINLDFWIRSTSPS